MTLWRRAQGDFIGNKRAWKFTAMVGRQHGTGCRGCKKRKFNIHTRGNEKLFQSINAMRCQ